MPAHMVGVRNGGGQSEVGFAVLQCLFGPADVFKRVNQVMVGGRIVCGQRQRGLVERNRVHIAGLAVSGPRSFVRKSAEDPESRVGGIGHQRVIDRFAVS